MRPRNQAPMAAMTALLTLAAGLLSAFPPQAVRTLERGLEARLLRLRGARSVPDSVVLVTIDDATLQQGAWFSDEGSAGEPVPPWAEGIHTLPWPRARYGDLLDRLREAEPAAVGINLVFQGASTGGRPTTPPWLELWSGRGVGWSWPPRCSTSARAASPA